jgi:hypothetical protein
MPRTPHASRRRTAAQRPAVRQVSSGREPPEAPPFVRRSLGSSRVAYKAAAAPCLGTEDRPLLLASAQRIGRCSLPRHGGSPSHRPCRSPAPGRAAAASSNSIGRVPNFSASTFSRACCCSPARSLLPPSRRLAGAGLPAAAARLCRGVPLPARPRLQPSPQTGRQRVPSHPPHLPWPTRAAGSPDFGRNRRRPPRGTQLRASSYFQGLCRKVRAYL